MLKKDDKRLQVVYYSQYRLMNAAPNSRLTIIIFIAQMTRRVPGPERCHDQISAIGALTIMTDITRKGHPMINTTMVPLRPTCWKFGLLGVTPVIHFVST
jgi:hypothetical protein